MKDQSSNWLALLAHPTLLYAGSHMNTGFVISSFLHLTLCFILLGICASDYLCPAVSRITNGESGSARKGLLAAVLLSWCNSSPDLFTNFVSWTSSDAAALSIGEVLGSCGFILCVVQGAVFMVMSGTQVQLEPEQRQHITQDLCFILASMILMLYVCIQNEVTLFNCVIMLAVYAGYIFSKAGFKPKNNNSDPINADPAGQDLASDAEYLTEADAGLKYSILSGMDYEALYSLMQKSANSGSDTITLRTFHSNSPTTQIVQPRPFTEPNDYTSQYTDDDRLHAHSSPSSFEPFRDNQDAPRLDQPNVPLDPIQFSQVVHKRLRRVRKGALFLLAPQLLGFNQKKLYAKLAALCMAPLTVLLRLSCPQYLSLISQEEEFGSMIRLENTNLILLATQAVFAPICSIIVFWILTGWNLDWYFWVISAVLSVILESTIVIFLHKVHKHNKFSLNEDSNHDERSYFKLLAFERSVMIIFSTVGILNSILWISVLANALVEVVQVYQRFTSISEAILGLTIFSWGNSISDLMSNVAMCKLYRRIENTNNDQRNYWASKYFFISLSACLGGALLNSLLGIGLSGFVAMLIKSKGVKSDTYWFLRSELLGTSTHLELKFVISAVFIIVQIITLLVYFSGIPIIMKFLETKMKFVGIAMCFWWGLATLSNVLAETFMIQAS